MKTQAEADAFLASVERWQDEHGDVAMPCPEYIELYEFKETLDFSQHEAKFVETTADMAYKVGENGRVDEDVSWKIELVDFGVAYLHLYCTPDIEDMGSWAEFWFKNEPWWNGDDPYECNVKQLVTLIRSLPEDVLQKYVELASRKPELVEFLTENGVIDRPVPAP